MKKELPYFKFIVAKWLTGDIVYESFAVQGLFINVCAIYWQRKGVLSIDDINKRFKNPKELAKLSDRFFSLENGLIKISFLDDQILDQKDLSKNNSANGKKGAAAKAAKKEGVQATAKRPLSDTSANLSNIDKKRKEKNTSASLNFEFVEQAWKIPFSIWTKYMAEKDRPFTIQMSAEAAYSQLKQVSEGSALEAMKIVQYTISGGWVSFCKPNKSFNVPVQTGGLQGTI